MPHFISQVPDDNEYWMNDQPIDDNFDEVIKDQLNQPTADQDVEQAVNNNQNIDVTLWRSTTGQNVENIQQHHSAGGIEADPQVEAPNHQQQQQQIAQGGVVPEFTADPNVTGFSWRHWLVVVRINTQYLRRGSVNESGWICNRAAPVQVLDTVDRTVGLQEPQGFGAA